MTTDARRLKYYMYVYTTEVIPHDVTVRRGVVCVQEYKYVHLPANRQPASLCCLDEESAKIQQWESAQWRGWCFP